MADSLETREERLAYFNENAKPLFGRTWVIFGVNGRIAALGEQSEADEFFERFNRWCDSEEASFPPRKAGMG